MQERNYTWGEFGMGFGGPITLKHESDNTINLFLTVKANQTNCLGKVIIRDRFVRRDDVAFIESGQEEAMQK